MTAFPLFPTLTPRPRTLALLAAACLLPHAHAQATLLSDIRRATATSSVPSQQDAFSVTPPAPFAPFDLPLRSTAAASATASVGASSSHTSSVSPTAFSARGSASAHGTSSSNENAFGQASSSFFISFRLPDANHAHLEANLTRGAVSAAQLILQRSDGSISHIYDGTQAQPILLDRDLPPGDYTLVAYASAAISLFPGANLSDGCQFEMNFTLEPPPPPCPADFNTDGFLDFFDYADYVDCFESGSCPDGATADFNNDGFVDFFDYDDFVLAFEQGC